MTFTRTMITTGFFSRRCSLVVAVPIFISINHISFRIVNGFVHSPLPAVYHHELNYISPIDTDKQQQQQQQHHHKQCLRRSSLFVTTPIFSTDETALSFWILAFSATHIGLSAVRNSIIDSLGNAVSPLLTEENWRTLPDWWPGDTIGGKQLFPSPDIAGRQIYRTIYTIISFWTLGSAFNAYLSASTNTGSNVYVDSFWYNLAFVIASISSGISIASLSNASPLSLVPGFESNLQRNDEIKYIPYGLTRITRHPLILPVVPWGISNSYLMGNRVCDQILFIGLSIYAILGCLAQDLRISKQEGSVGTSFTSFDKLTEFYGTTSFIPFGAILNGKQSLKVQETPWLALVIGTVVGFFLEKLLLEVLHEWSI